MKKLVETVIQCHRWLGICFCLFFAIWFLSGIFMIYVRMPEFAEPDRLAPLPGINLSMAQITPAQAFQKTKLDNWPLRIVIGTALDRPVYRFLPQSGRWTTIFADTGEILYGLVPSAAIQVTAPYAKPSGFNSRVIRELRAADQWTVSSASRPYFPFQLVSAGDAAGTRYYVSEATATIFLRTTRHERLLAWFSAIPHWWYIRALRANTPLWRAVVIGASSCGVLLSLAGILIAILRFSPSKRYRFRGERHSFIPYLGWKRWHYFLGAFLGLATFSWILSGMFSMNPGNWSPGPDPSEEEIRKFAGANLDPAIFHLAPSQAAHLFAQCMLPIELEMIMFQGRPYYLARDRQLRTRLLLASADTSSANCISELPAVDLLQAGRRAVDNLVAVDSAMLRSYDSYYHDRDYRKPLPIFRMRFADTRQTWLYVDPRTGLIEARYTRRSRLERWLYQGLHDLDFPFLYWHRPAWDVLVIGLCIGGMVLSITGIVLAASYLRKGAKKRFGKAVGLMNISTAKN